MDPQGSTIALRALVWAMLPDRFHDLPAADAERDALRSFVGAKVMFVYRARAAALNASMVCSHLVVLAGSMMIG